MSYSVEESRASVRAGVVEGPVLVQPALRQLGRFGPTSDWPAVQLAEDRMRIAAARVSGLEMPCRNGYLLHE